ncbi:manganese efflux pump MntP [Butyrivibrio sp. VCB2006]|uniref:manganese efflux pump MntP n=1 Tax=Butyrivibrio sp. VCB2006 TaxID=1280679 RepID=UPI00042717BD|nr:manganese efflux pump [Butyrivibrio sp. VCB2006]
MYFILIFNSVMLGFGLAMDAFSVSLANGFADHNMKRSRKIQIAGCYAVFQFAMPVIGWFLVHNAATFFEGFQKFIPWIALILLAIIGGKMLVEGILDRRAERNCKGGLECNKCSIESCRKYGIDPEAGSISNKVLFMQGIATSIDALSVGFTISEYHIVQTLLSAFIIGGVTYVVCYVGLKLGIVFGTKLASRAKIIGGLILIGIGIEIFFS